MTESRFDRKLAARLTQLRDFYDKLDAFKHPPKRGSRNKMHLALWKSIQTEVKTDRLKQELLDRFTAFWDGNTPNKPKRF